MWQPDPSWHQLPGVSGPATEGIWRAEAGGRRWVVKRLAAPSERNHARAEPGHAGYWRREAEVASCPSVVNGPGLVPAEFGRVDEDDAGVTIWALEETGEPPAGLLVAHALGRFAAAPHLTPGWAAQRLLSQRLAMAEGRGGWPTLARTPLADVAEHLWRRRGHWLDRCAEGPQGRVHGDPVPGNFLTGRGDDVVAVDWQCFGTGPVGSDLGYYALSVREGFEVLLDAFLAGVAASAGPAVDLTAGPTNARTAITRAARVTAVYTVLSRAEWALAQVAAGEGALAGKFRHPAVAPHLRALQRQFTQIEPLLH